MRFSSLARKGDALHGVLATALIAGMLFSVSCGGGPEVKKDVRPEAGAQSTQMAQGGETPQAAKPAEPAPAPVPALVAPVAVMVAVPGERSEKDILADADKRSELMKPRIQKEISSVVAGPYPEVKEEKVEKKPEPEAVATAKEATAVNPAPAPSPVRVEVPVQRAIVSPATRTRPQTLEDGVPDLTLVKKFTTADGLPNNLISAIYVDETEAWVGTSGGGVGRYIFAENNWIVTGASGGLPSDYVTDVIKFKGNVYVGTKNGIAVWDNFAWTTMTEAFQVQLQNVNFTVKGGELWVAARNMRGGLLTYDGSKWTDKSNVRQGIILNNVSDFVFDGDDLWLGTTSRGVYVKRAKDWGHFSVTEGIASNFIYTMAVRNGRAYLGGCCGVSYYDGEKWTIYDVPEGLPHSTVNALVWDPSGIVWLGSKNGLSGWDSSFFRNFYVEDGLLPDNHVTALFLSGDDLWVGTVGGLSLLRKNQ